MTTIVQASNTGEGTPEVTSTPAVELRDVTLVFGGDNPKSKPVQAVDTLNVAIPAGQFVAVVGPSGCGKTTILNLLAGLLKPTRGSVMRYAKPVNGPSRDIGYMLARAGLSPWRTARRNVELGLELRGVSRAERRERADRLLSQLRLDAFADAYPAQLSQGMRQRVAIARTLAIDPDLWLLDEPFSALDAQTRLAVQAEFIALWEARPHKTVILVTHDLEEAVLLADRVIVMTARPGRIKSDTFIDLPRPRDIDELRFDERFREAEHRIWKELRDEIV
jgi:NitT/TauT family transport system ATP-binding protein